MSASEQIKIAHTNTTTIQAYHRIHQNAQTSSGGIVPLLEHILSFKHTTESARILKHLLVLCALPEPILSFKLSGLQRLSDGFIPEAEEMINLQKWLAFHAHDVLDESDNILASRTQLIYPSGTQRSVDGNPIR
jgi:hypothetical protein